MTDPVQTPKWNCNLCGRTYALEIEALNCICILSNPHHAGPMLHSQRPYKTKRFAQLMAEGFFFCGDCECVTELRDVDEVQAHCALCGSPKLHWNEPVKL